MKSNLKLSLLIAFVCVSCSTAFAWGPVSHIALTYESGIKNGFPVSKDLLGAYLAGATEPDVGLDDGKSEDYGTYHSENFAKAMENVAQTKKSPAREILMARAAGIRSHMAGDSAAHGKTGYSEAKIMYPNLQTGLPKHTTNELCTDIIMYDRNKDALKKQSLNFLDVNTLIEVRKEFTKMTGKELANDREKLKKELFNHKAMVLTELSLANHLANSDPEKVKQMKKLYSDLDVGVVEGKGANMAISRIAERAKPSEDLTNFKTKNQGFKIKNFFSNSLLSKSFQALERGALKFMKSSLVRDTFANVAEGKVSNARNKAFVNFGVNLLNKNLTFEQAVVLASKATSGYPEGLEQKVAYLEIEAQALKWQRDKAYEAYNNRPWWKVWLFFTQSDKKKYEKLNAEYKEKMLEIEQIRGTIAKANVELPVSDASFDAAIVEASMIAETSSNLVNLQAKVDTAYQKFVKAAGSQDHETLKIAEKELLEAKEKLKAAIEN